jgi:glycosyltransferase involved in cell wall biosynthesis
VGVPVIATGAGGSGEFLRHEENCLIFQPREDPGALAAAVERLRRDHSLRTALREGGFRTAPRYTDAAFNEAVLAELELAAGPRD